MNRISASLAVSVVVVGLSACADSATKTVEPSLQQPVFTQYPEFANDKHIMKLKDEGKKDAEDAQKVQDEAKLKPGAGSGIYYHGGPVLQAATNVVSVYWST